MSTHCLISGRRRVFRLPAFSVLGGLLLALQLWLPASAFAAARENALPAQDVARAGVSVVRLLVSYSMSKTTTACTGLGVLLSSQLKAETKKYENWVLTDGTLVNSENQATCLDAGPTATLSRIDIYMSSSYHAQPVAQFSATAPAVSCRTRPAKCSEGPALFSFSSDLPLPFVDLSPALPSTGTPVSDTRQVLQLMSNDNTVGMLTPFNQDPNRLDTYKKQAQAFLLPNAVPSTSTRQLEDGAPLVDSTGALAGLYLANAPRMTADEISLFVKNTMPGILDVSNPVHDNWKSGMDAFYTRHATSEANTDFKQAFQANQQFEGAQHFAALAAQGSNASNFVVASKKASAESVPAPSSSLLDKGVQIAGLDIRYWQLAVAGVVLFVVLALLLILVLSNMARRRRRSRLAIELADAERQAAIEARRIAEQEAMQREKELHPANGVTKTPSGQMQPAVPIQYSPVSQQALGEQEGFSSAMTERRCPRCGKEVAADANFCANCRLQLSPTDSGQHMRVVPPQAPAQAQPPAVSPLAAQPSPSDRSLADQPTFFPAVPLTDQPTLDMTGVAQSQNSKSDLEKTVPYAVRHLNGQHLGFVVGTRSDPGIKRKYKPNEDSLFAAQGVLAQSSPQLFGLFVVADGMGGHANGEDASRLAIQTIADYLLPRLTQNTNMQGEQYAQLLIEGVQQANLAVHQNNVQKHADMGTTITATLLVDTVAYVANVGDSRTYLYRPSEGLKKVTVDHSVVASLVEAGIIKPDDIYTHPKRNQIYRSLGEKAAVEVDSFTVQLQAGDKLLLCSDGLWDMVRDPQIEAVIKNPDPNPTVTGEALIQSALDGGGEDNVSVIVVHITDGMKSGAMPRFQLLTKPDSVQLPQI